MDELRRYEVDEETPGGFATDLVKEVDRVFLSMGKLEFSDFVLKLRDLARSLDKTIVAVMHE